VIIWLWREFISAGEIWPGLVIRRRQSPRSADNLDALSSTILHCHAEQSVLYKRWVVFDVYTVNVVNIQILNSGGKIALLSAATRRCNVQTYHPKNLHHRKNSEHSIAEVGASPVRGKGATQF
jgi:hypothetical protein